MRCIIAGSRDLSDRVAVFAAIEACPFASEIDEVVSGAARGVDTLGEEYAIARGLKVTRFFVTGEDWKTLGRAAGPIRNRKMGDYAEALIAIPETDTPKRGSGTWDMIAYATERKLRIYVCPQSRALELVRGAPRAEGPQLGLL
jgi:hypothetical protein